MRFVLIRNDFSEKTDVGSEDLEEAYVEVFQNAKITIFEERNSSPQLPAFSFDDVSRYSDVLKTVYFQKSTVLPDLKFIKGDWKIFERRQGLGSGVCDLVGLDELVDVCIGLIYFVLNKTNQIPIFLSSDQYGSSSDLVAKEKQLVLLHVDQLKLKILSLISLVLLSIIWVTCLIIRVKARRAFLVGRLEILSKPDFLASLFFCLRSLGLCVDEQCRCGEQFVAFKQRPISSKIRWKFNRSVFGLVF